MGRGTKEARGFRIRSLRLTFIRQPVRVNYTRFQRLPPKSAANTRVEPCSTESVSTRCSFKLTRDIDDDSFRSFSFLSLSLSFLIRANEKKCLVWRSENGWKFDGVRSNWSELEGVKSGAMQGQESKDFTGRLFGKQRRNNNERVSMVYRMFVHAGATKRVKWARGKGEMVRE